MIHIFSFKFCPLERPGLPLTVAYLSLPQLSEEPRFKFYKKIQNLIQDRNKHNLSTVEHRYRIEDDINQEVRFRYTWDRELNFNDFDLGGLRCIYILILIGHVMYPIKITAHESR